MMLRSAIFVTIWLLHLTSLIFTAIWSKLRSKFQGLNATFCSWQSMIKLGKDSSMTIIRSVITAIRIWSSTKNWLSISRASVNSKTSRTDGLTSSTKVSFSTTPVVTKIFLRCLLVSKIRAPTSQVYSSSSCSDAVTTFTRAAWTKKSKSTLKIKTVWLPNFIRMKSTRPNPTLWVRNTKSLQNSTMTPIVAFWKLKSICKTMRESRNTPNWSAWFAMLMILFMIRLRPWRRREIKRSESLIEHFFFIL